MIPDQNRINREIVVSYVSKFMALNRIKKYFTYKRVVMSASALLHAVPVSKSICNSKM